MKKSLIVLLGLCWAPMLFSQTDPWGEDDNLGNRELGMKLGIGQSTIFGGELQNPSLKTGFQAGFFWYGKKTEKRLNWQTGLEVCLLGSNFNSQVKDSLGIISNTAYTQLGIIQIEIPLLANIRLRKTTDKRYESLQVGLIPGAIVNSVIYTGEFKDPHQQTNLNRWKNLPLHPLNLQASLGYQYRGGTSGYVVRLKASLLDLNDNFVLPGLEPETGTGKRIGTMGVEFAVLF
jgi:hypothetical protein